ncbi:MAG: hypothetical protein GY925_30515 [Actinomycetia bacterium]|nr:hypothetical protein [Actinomycetes bacterium]
MADSREPTLDERAVLDAWLRHETENSELLRRQLSHGYRVTPSCECGCASIAFNLGDDAAHYRLLADGAYAVEGLVEIDGVVGGLILFIRDGLASSVDAHSFGEMQLAFPNPESVRWGGRRHDHAVLPFDAELVVKATNISHVANRIAERFEPIKGRGGRYAAITSVHDEYDLDSGHIGPLRNYLYFFDEQGAPLPGAFVCTDSNDEALGVASELAGHPPSWAAFEEPLGESGGLPASVISALEHDQRRSS